MTKMMKRNAGFRVLTVFVALLVLCAGPLHVLGEAHAIAILDDLIMAGGVLLIGTILAASGVKFLSQTDLLGASRTLLDKIRETDPSTWTGLTRIIAPLCAAGVKGSDYVMRLSQDLWDKVVGTFKGDIIKDGEFVIGAGESVTITVENEAEIADAFCEAYNAKPRIGFIYVNGERWELTTRWGDFAIKKDSGEYIGVCNGYGYTEEQKYEQPKWYYLNSMPYRHDYLNLYCMVGDDTLLDFLTLYYPVTIAYPGESIDIEGIANLPNNLVNSIRLPDMPTMAEDGTITYPDLPLNPEANLGQVADLPGYSDVATVPVDLPINAETGKVITDVPDVPDVPDIPALPTLGDVIGAIGQVTGALEGVGTAAGSLANTAAGIAGAIDNFFDSPSDFSLDFTGFQNLILKDRFPFSIPFDMVNCIRVFAASAEDFTFKIDLETDYFQVHHVVDLTPFRIPFAFFRYVAVIWFTWVLISKTRDVMKW